MTLVDGSADSARSAPRRAPAGDDHRVVRAVRPADDRVVRSRMCRRFRPRGRYLRQSLVSPAGSAARGADGVRRNRRAARGRSVHAGRRARRRGRGCRPPQRRRQGRRAHADARGVAALRSSAVRQRTHVVRDRAEGACSRASRSSPRCRRRRAWRSSWRRHPASRSSVSCAATASTSTRTHGQ